jgi:hypothetical protein
VLTVKLATLLAAIIVSVTLTPTQARAEVLVQKKAQGTSQQVHADELPAAVTAAVQKSYPGSSIAVAYKVTRGADVRYQLWLKESAKGPAVVVTATPDGQLQTSGGRKAARPAPTQAVKPARSAAKDAGDPVAIDQLPKAVTKAIKDAYPKNTIIRAFKSSTADPIVYQLVLDDVASLQPMRVFVAADGKIQKR